MSKPSVKFFLLCKDEGSSSNRASKIDLWTFKKTWVDHLLDDLWKIDESCVVGFGF